jgi:hypothetical protein
VPLSPLAREILSGITPGSEYVFSTRNGRTPVQLGAKPKDRLDARMDVSDWVFHDLRRTCTTEMTRLKVDPHVIEAVLNHVSGPAKAGVAGVYNKWAYLPEKTAALERWATHVEGLITGTTAKVVQLRG